MVRNQFRILIAAFLVVVFATALAAQTGHVLHGTLEVDESEATGPVPQTFVLVLRNALGEIIGRDSVANGGQYRFSQVRQGELTIAVEADNQELARMTIFITGTTPAYVRRDVSMAWKERGGGSEDHPAGSVLYARDRGNQKLFDQAEKLSGEGDLSKAAEILEQLLKSDPNDFESWTELGTLRFRQERLDAAESAYRKASELHPTYLLAWINLGKLHLAKEEFQEAVDCFTKATVLDASRAEAFYFLGDSYLKLRKGSLAVPALEKSLELDPIGMADAHLLLGSLYSAARYSDRAVEEYRQFLKKKPDSPMKDELKAYIEKHQ